MVLYRSTPSRRHRAPRILEVSQLVSIAWSTLDSGHDSPLEALLPGGAPVATLGDQPSRQQDRKTE